MILTESQILRVAENASDYDGSMSKTCFAEKLENAMLNAIKMKDPVFHDLLVAKLAELGLNHRI